MAKLKTDADTKRLKRITNSNKTCFTKVKNRIVELENEMKNTSMELSFLILKREKLKKESTVFAKSEQITPYKMVEFGIWQLAVEEQLLLIDDNSFLCHASCIYCKKKK